MIGGISARASFAAFESLDEFVDAYVDLPTSVRYQAVLDRRQSSSMAIVCGRQVMQRIQSIR